MEVFLFAFRYQSKPNISEQIVSRLPYKQIVLPPPYDYQSLVKKIKKKGPDIVLGLGQSKKGNLVRIERVARNILKKEGKTIKYGSQICRTTLRIQNIAGTRISYNAGTYSCNYILYRLLRDFPDLPIGFLHIPKTMPLETAYRTVKQIIRSIKHNN